MAGSDARQWCVSGALAILAVAATALPGLAQNASHPLVHRGATITPIRVPGKGLNRPVTPPAGNELEAQDEHPLSKRAWDIKNGLVMPIVPQAKAVRISPPPSGSAPPQLGLSFEGTDQGFGVFPPDGGLGVGPLYLVQVANSHINYFTKDGRQTLASDPTSFFGSPSQLVDPEILYDTLSNRFYFSEFNRDEQLYLSASNTSDPNDGWCTYVIDARIPAGTTTDFTQMGVARDAVFVGLNQSNGQNLTIWFNKAQVMACQTATFFFINNLTHCDGSTNVFCLRPAKMHSFNNLEFLAGTDSTDSVTVWRVTDPAGSPTLDRA